MMICFHTTAGTFRLDLYFSNGRSVGEESVARRQIVMLMTSLLLVRSKCVRIRGRDYAQQPNSVLVSHGVYHTQDHSC